MAITNFI